MAHPATPVTTTASRFHFPSAYTILFALIVIIAGLTWVIPAGQHERAASEALGKDVPVAGTYAPTDANPQGFFDVRHARPARQGEVPPKQQPWS